MKRILLSWSGASAHAPLEPQQWDSASSEGTVAHHLLCVHSDVCSEARLSSFCSTGFVSQSSGAGSLTVELRQIVFGVSFCGLMYRLGAFICPMARACIKQACQPRVAGWRFV